MQQEERLAIFNALERIIAECIALKRMLSVKTAMTPQPGFEQFWTAYGPSNYGTSTQAKLAWDMNVTKDDVPLIMATLAKKKWPVERKYKPSAARWLVSKEWLNKHQEENDGKYAGLGEALPGQR